MARIPATSAPAPSIIASSSVSIRFSRPTKQTASVPTTFSFANKPGDCRSCQLPGMDADNRDQQPCKRSWQSTQGWKRPLFRATPRCQSKVCMICTAVLHSRMMVAALRNIRLATAAHRLKRSQREGTLYSGSSMIKKDLSGLIAGNFVDQQRTDKNQGLYRSGTSAY